MEFDFDDIKGVLLEFFYKHKKIIIIACSVFLSALVLVFFLVKSDYNSRVESSQALNAYIFGENDSFMKNKHKKGYGLIKQVLKAQENPSIEAYDKFASMDEYVFKPLFYFSKSIVFGFSDDNEAYYAAKSHPWSSLMLTSKMFNNKATKEDLKELSKRNADHIIGYMIGKGWEC